MNIEENKKIRILIIAISPADEGLFLPLIYGHLRSYADCFEELKASCSWLDPVILPTEADELPKADIYAFSIYSWNALYSYKLAQNLKNLYPESLVVAGGPEIDWKNPDFFNIYPYLDAIIPKDGEIPFSNLLKRLLHSSLLLDIQGIMTNPAYGDSSYVPCVQIDLSSKPGSWISLRDFWIKYAEKYRKYKLAACLETCRGCPYGCIYCDWGGQCKGSLNPVTKETALQEMDFLQKEIKPFFIFWTDGNLGILERDLELAEHFAYNKRKYSYPVSIYYNCDKNNWKAGMKIANYFRKAGLLTKYIIALQHTDEDVLKNIRRVNMPEENELLLVRHMQENDVSIYVQLIMGCPGDNYSKWLNTYAHLMDMGIHGEYRAYPFGLFPNAKASEPEYMKKWEIYAPYRTNYVPFFTLKKEDLNYALSKSRYVLSTKSYSLSEYAKMLKLSLLISACHDHGFTRFISIGLHSKYGMGYDEFYDRLLKISEGQPYFEQMEIFADNWITNEDAAFVVMNNLTHTLIEAEEELVLDIYDHYEEFYDRLRDCFYIPEDLLYYQKNILYRPESLPENGRQIYMPAQWAGFFDPDLNENGTYIETDKRLHFAGAWYRESDMELKYRKFYSQIVHHNIPGGTRSAIKALINPDV